MISIHFENLFSRFDYDVELNKDGLTILTGPNGYGKSTILKSIEALSKGILGIKFFFELDFEKINLKFKSGDEINIEKKEKYLLIDDVKFEEKKIIRFLTNIMDSNPYLTRFDENSWFDRRKGCRVTINDYKSYTNYDFVGERIINGIRYKKDLEVLNQEYKCAIERIKRLVGNIYFIKEQRLIKEGRTVRDEQDVVNVIDGLPRAFIDLFNGVQQNYSAVANKLDSTYPYRLFNNEEIISETEYKLKIEAMSNKFEKLNKYGLTAAQNTVNFIFKDEHAKALKIYFDDFEEKYGVYKDFIMKLDLYTDIINNRLSFKQIKISGEKGIIVVDSNLKVLNLNQLSSGEKQEIVLFYELIFGTKENILLLIDEPEISLHIVWQKKFMDDLLRIIKYKKINVIVATHSPQIINNHWDRQIDLGELYGMQFNKK